MPASPRGIAGLSSSASAGPIGCTSGRCAFDFGVLGGFFGVSEDFAIGQIWDESGPHKRAVSPPPSVMAGLDPAIHPLRKILPKWMDARVKPAHDGCALFVPETQLS